MNDIIARYYAAKLVNGDVNNTCQNRPVLLALAKQFSEWPDIEQRSNLPIFLVQVTPLHAGIPIFQHVSNFAVSDKSAMGAAFKVKNHMGLPFDIIPGNNTFLIKTHMMKVSFWAKGNYNSQFQIL